MVDPEAALREAIEKAGGQSALARALEISVQAVSQWKVAPPARVIEIENLTKISRHALRPDIFGTHPPQSSGAAA